MFTSVSVIVFILNNYDRGRRLRLITLTETLILILERAYKPVFFFCVMLSSMFLFF